MNLILHEIKKGNRKVFKTFFNKNYNAFVIYANGYLYDKDTSEDIVQDVLIYLWENAKKMDIQSSLKAYLYAMIRNRCLKHLKTIKITDNARFLDFNITLITEQVFETADEKDKQIIYQELLKIVDALPDKMQQIVKLKFLQNYKYVEIAEELNISINTVKTQLKRAKIKITEAITILLILLQSP